MSKIKMRCSVCGKPFKSANPKQLMCETCEAKARREKNKQQVKSATPPPAAKPPSYTLPPMTGTAPSAALTPAPPSPSASAPAASRPGAGQRPGPPARAGAPASAHINGRPAGGARPPERPKAHRPPSEGEPRQRPRRQPTPQQRKEPRPPTPPFEPTPEQVAAVERRYLELANPTEYDGIRTQIAQELNIPKTAVKKIVQAVRTQLHMPSWWDIQGYHGTPEDLERIRQLYTPYLPVPPIGVHRLLAKELELHPGMIYQAIKTIRAEMDLPQYNPPELHEDELPAATREPQAASTGAPSPGEHMATVETADSLAPMPDEA
jgi:hypothetical protein